VFAPIAEAVGRLRLLAMEKKSTDLPPLREAEKSPAAVRRAEEVCHSRLVTVMEICRHPRLTAQQAYNRLVMQIDDWEFSDMEPDPTLRMYKEHGAYGTFRPEPLAGHGVTEGSGSPSMPQPDLQQAVVTEEERKKRLIEENKAKALAKKKAKTEAAVFAAMQWLP